MELLIAFDIAIKKLSKSNKPEEQEAVRVLDGFRAAIVKTRNKKEHLERAFAPASTSTTTNPTG